MRQRSPFDLDDDDGDARPRRVSHNCVCGSDLPGTCPGPVSCPYSGLDDDVSDFEKAIEDDGTACDGTA